MFILPGGASWASYKQVSAKIIRNWSSVRLVTPVASPEMDRSVCVSNVARSASSVSAKSISASACSGSNPRRSCSDSESILLRLIRFSPLWVAPPSTEVVVRSDAQPPSI